MNTIKFHIADWTVATRHLTRIERSIYFDLLCIYYDREGPLPADGMERLARRVMAHTEEEVAALESVIGEFFTLDGDVYRHHRCDEEIASVHQMVAKKSMAGKASARARRKMSAKGTPVERVLNGCQTTEQLPITHNPLPDTQNTSCSEPTVSEQAITEKTEESSRVIASLPTNRTDTKGEFFYLTEAHFNELSYTYPAVATMQQIREARHWLISNPKKRKTHDGMLRFLNSWFSKKQNSGGGCASSVSPSMSTRERSLEQDLTDTSWHTATNSLPPSMGQYVDGGGGSKP